MRERVQQFIRAYIGEAKGNATRAAVLAGYKERSAYVQGYRLLRNAHVQAQILEHKQKADALAIATRADRQRFWTTTMTETKEATRDRLKASELLGRSERDFDDGVKVQVNVPTQVVFAIRQQGDSDNKT